MVNSDIDTERVMAPFGQFRRALKPLAGHGRVSVSFPGVECYLVLSRSKSPYWCVPKHGEREVAFSGDGQFFLWRDEDGDYHLLIPLVSLGCRTVLKYHDGNVWLETEGPERGSSDRPFLAYESEGKDPYAMLREASREIAEVVKTVRIREEKAAPDWMDLFGWCTWDAFYQDINESKVMEGLKSWATAGIIPGFMVLDDGWLDVTGDYLNEQTPDKDKFPEGLEPFIRQAKNLGVGCFGVWHAIPGYWAGINPKSSLGKAWPLVHNQNKIRPWFKDKDQEIDLHMVDPKLISGYYDVYYRYLKSLGVDMVKVDGQSSLEYFSESVMDRVPVMEAYQKALQEAATEHLNGNLLHCMSHSSDVVFSLKLSSAIRNSDDYFPSQGADIQQEHIYLNTYNALYMSLFGYPDWDMFQSHHEHSAFHAAARAISGGPVYVSDKAGKQNVDLLKKLIFIEDGVTKAIRFPDPALPSPSSLLTNTRYGAELLKIFNHANGLGLLGVFHCTDRNDSLVASISTEDIPVLDPGIRYALWFHREQCVICLEPGGSTKIKLNQMEYELVTFSPIVNGVAVFGLLDKFNGPGSLRALEYGEQGVQFGVCDGGQIGVYVDGPVKGVWLDGDECDHEYDKDSGLLVISAEAGLGYAVEV